MPVPCRGDVSSAEWGELLALDNLSLKLGMAVTTHTFPLTFPSSSFFFFLSLREKRNNNNNFKA